jgi:hypothetical protein
MERWEEILRDHRGLFTPVARNWPPQELALAYELVASYTGKAQRDSGCGACRRSTIQRAIKIAQGWKPHEDTGV